MDDTAHGSIGVDERRVSHFAEDEVAGSGFGKNAIEIVLEEGAGFFGEDMFAGTEGSEGVGGLIGTDRRAKDDELDVGISEEVFECFVHAQGGPVGVPLGKWRLGKARAGCEAGEGIFQKVTVDLMAVRSEQTNLKA